MVAPVPSSRKILARIWFAILATFSVTLGFLPFVLFRSYRLGFYLIVIAGLSLLISLAFSVSLDLKNERPVSLTERLAIAVAALSEGSIIGFVLFLFYGTGWLVTVILDKVGWHPNWINTLGTIVLDSFGFIFLVGVIGITTERLTKWLFPTTGIGNARLLPYTKAREWSWPKVVAAIWMMIIVVFGFFYIRYLFYLLLQFALVGIGAPLAQRLGKREPSERAQTLRAAVKNLLESCGYTVVERMHTGDLDVDRLISVFDLFAYSGGFGLAIQLKSDEESTDPVVWTEASYLISATRVIYSATEKLDQPISSVIPMMILCGRKADSKLASFGSREPIRIVEMPAWSTVEDIAHNKLSSEALRETAQSYLGLDARSSGEKASTQELSEAHV